jgi:hypothetical protein
MTELSPDVTMKMLIVFPYFILLVSIGGLNSFRTFPVGFTVRKSALRSTWQQDLDGVLNVDTPCDTRIELTKSIAGNLNNITADVFDAVLDKDLEKVAPRDLSYGKSIRGISAFRHQLLSDVLPEFLQNTVHKLVGDAPQVARKIMSTSPMKLIDQGNAVLQRVKKVVDDPSKLESLVENARKELKNVVRRTPEGLQSPSYTVLETREAFELRLYPSMALCSTPCSSGIFAENAFEQNSSQDSARAFQTLARYIFGQNRKDGAPEKLSMTVPIIMRPSSMNFVLPDGLTSQTAPAPLSNAVTLLNTQEEVVAAREFSGLITEGEVARERAKLEDALIDAGIVYDTPSFRVLAYNSPLTLPWVRRNEVMFRVHYPSAPKTPSMSMTEQGGVDPSRSSPDPLSSVEPMVGVPTSAQLATDALIGEDENPRSVEGESAEGGDSSDRDTAATAAFFTAPEAGD